MIIRVEYGDAVIHYADKVKAPTPEHVDDILRRIERSLVRIWQGETPAEVDLSTFEQAEPE